MELNVLNILICALSITLIFAWIITMMTIDIKNKGNSTLALIVTDIIGVLITLFALKVIPFKPSDTEAFIGSLIGLAISIIVDTIIIKVVKHKKLDDKTT